MSRDNPIRFKFKKEEILRSRKQIDALFREGRSAFRHPIRMMWIRVNVSADITQALFVVPKRSFKKAHDRNRLRRRLKEAYRLQKHILDATNGSLLMAFVYAGTADETYAVISKSMNKLLSEIAARRD